MAKLKLGNYVVYRDPDGKLLNNKKVHIVGNVKEGRTLCVESIYPEQDRIYKNLPKICQGTKVTLCSECKKLQAAKKTAKKSPAKKKK